MSSDLPDELRASRPDGAELSLIPARVVWPLTVAIAVAMLALRLAFAVTELWSQSAGAALGPVLFEEVVGSVVSFPYLFGTIWVLRRWPLTRTPRVTWAVRLGKTESVMTAHQGGWAKTDYNARMARTGLVIVMALRHVQQIFFCCIYLGETPCR